jgi:hypothetical protein
VSFFGPRPEPPQFPPDPAIGWRPPVWDRPSEHLLGVPVAVGGLLARTEKVALAFAQVVAYPNGFSFDLHIRGNPMVPRQRERMMGGPMMGHLGMGPRLGLQFADGSRAGAEGPPPFPGSMMTLTATTGQPGSPEGPLLMQRGGGGSDNSFSIGFWSWPLPPPGPMQVYVEWQDQDIPETSIEIDATGIAEAGPRATVLWPAPE